MANRRIDTDPLEAWEWERLRPHLEPHWQLVFDLLWATGVRLGEALALVKDEVGPNYIVVRRLKKRRETKPDVVPVSPDLAGRLLAHVGNKRRVRIFTQKENSAWAALRRAAAKAGIRSSVHPHLFRHAFGRRMAKLDLDLTALDHQEILARMLGHSSTRHVSRYVRPGETDVLAAWRRANERLQGGP